MVMYLSPFTRTPLAMTALVSLLSLKEAAIALISAAVSEKPGDEAQVVWPLTSQMSALSMLPVPTRLQRVSIARSRGAVRGRAHTSGRRMLAKTW